MNETRAAESFISLERAAARLGVPIAWLRAEAHAGRVPCLWAGRRLLFNAVDVERALIERAQSSATKGGDDE